MPGVIFWVGFLSTDPPGRTWQIQTVSADGLELGYELSYKYSDGSNKSLLSSVDISGDSGDLLHRVELSYTDNYVDDTYVQIQNNRIGDYELASGYQTPVVGDFNGDALDDILFHCDGGCPGYGEHFAFGFGSPDSGLSSQANWRECWFAQYIRRFQNI